MLDTAATISAIDRCLDVQERAKTRIPGMSGLLSKRPDMFSLGVWPGYYSRASGSRVWDLDGNEYIDMSIGGIGANALGYADPDVDNAVIDAIKNGSSSSLNCEEEVRLAELLCDIHPWAEKARFARTGGEAMAMAVRIARAHTGKDLVAFCGYHGWHDWYLAANLDTENALGGHLLDGLEPTGVPKALKGTALPFRYNDIHALEEIVNQNKGKLGVIVMEPVRNEWPEEGFLREVREIADAHGAVLIFDEITSGFRMNTGGIHLILNATPDIAVFSKALGNGYPISAVIGKSHIMESAQKSFISSTNWTERLGPAAALATINKFRSNNVADHLINTGKNIQDGWKKLATKNNLVIDVGGLAPLSHFSFREKPLASKSLFVQLMLERGYLASNQFYAMYAHSEKDVGGYLEAVDESFAKIADCLKNDTVELRMKGKPSTAGFKRLN